MKFIDDPLGLLNHASALSHWNKTVADPGIFKERVVGVPDYITMLKFVCLWLGGLQYNFQSSCLDGDGWIRSNARPSPKVCANRKTESYIICSHRRL